MSSQRTCPASLVAAPPSDPRTPAVLVHSRRSALPLCPAHSPTERLCSISFISNAGSSSLVGFPNCHTVLKNRTNKKKRKWLRNIISVRLVILDELLFVLLLLAKTL